MYKIALITSHPVQYQVPWIRMLAATPGIDLNVFYSIIPTPKQQGAEYGIEFEWDQPLLEGYPYTVLKNVSRNPSPLRFSGCDTPEIYRIVCARRWDAVIVHGWYLKSSLQALVACRLSKTPCLIRGESSSLQPGSPMKISYHRLLLKQYSGYLAIGQRNREYYLKHGVAIDRIFFTPYGVENARFIKQSDDLLSQRNELRDRFGLPNTAVVYVYCGRFVEKKRPMDFVRAVELTRSTLKADSIYGLMIGEGPLRVGCEKYARDRGIPVRFGGFLNQNQITKAYVASDCLVLPSESDETWGLVTNETMASGRPALLSDQVGCVVDLIKPGVTGDTFRCKDIRSISESMAFYAKQPEKLYRMGVNARELVLEYGPEKVVTGVLDAITNVKKGEPRVVRRQRAVL